MEFSKRVKKILVLILMIIIVILLLLSLVRIWSSTPSSTNEHTPIVTKPTTQVEEPVVDEQTQAQQQEAAAEANVRTVVKSFSERYGSYSNEADFANVEDVLPLMTESYAARTREMMATWKTSDVYYAVTTHVIAMDIAMDETAGTAKATVHTQREEARGEVQNSSVSYQNLVLDLVRVSGSWFVDNAAWQ